MHGESCYTVNKWGRVRTEYVITGMAKDILKDDVFVGELYVADGNLYEFLRSRKDFKRLRLLKRPSNLSC